MSDFNTAIETVLGHEGYFVNDPVDPGGATKYGISLRFLKSIGDLDGDGVLDGDLDFDGNIDIDDVKNMTLEQAKVFYKTHWWNKYKYAEIKDQSIAEKVFDLAVNMGAIQAHKILQRACRALKMNLKEDGVLGNMTLSAVDHSSPFSLLVAIRSEAAGFYRALIAEKPQFEKYRNGWLNRAYS